MIVQKAAIKQELRKPRKQDGAAVWELIKRAGTLDLNSAYCYILLCDLYKDTCLVAEREGRIVGFVSALRPPGADDRLFIWQVAVDPGERGKGLGRAMLERMLATVAAEAPVRFIEATVSPSNTASLRLFKAVARELGCTFRVSEQHGYPAGLFPQGQHHESEPLVVIGPLR
ncbi:diaminobutyrate acetyltransferase [Paenibacillus sp. GCM10012307]|uniref:L-2,4-diaminobutyric acid acetyltransferase n=1 Tax=Paenibacillus roseus TaxID=2798579 RepID=A0A934J2Z1_9BACL|nr:diaminobutyrate acetyltransferase [Paenibacillus roseus]